MKVVNCAKQSFMCMFCISLFVLFLLAIVLSVLLRFTDFDYPFGIFKLFLPISCIVCKLVRVIYILTYCSYDIKNYNQ